MRQFIALMFAALVALPAFGQTELALPFGDEPGKVAYLNYKNNPGAEEPHPWGPLSFRNAGSEFWVADTVAGRVYRVDAAGKVLATIVTQKTSKNAVLEDIALVRDAAGTVSGVWVADGMEQQVVLYGTDGTKQKTFGAPGNEPGKFAQIARIEAGVSGRVYVTDKGRQRIIVFDPEGKVVRELPWQWSGLCLDKDENLYHLEWNDQEKRVHLVAETFDGKPMSNTVLDLPPHTNSELWFITPAGEAIITYSPDNAPLQALKMARCTLDGKLVAIIDIKLPIVMNRYLEPLDAESVWLGQVDYEKAPEGAFRVIPFKYGTKPEG
ncbi:hypothetical protein KBA41_06795 [Candidatus Ozemobacteraceae bacterium]|nr:hypothetical protein [Candidatus Ozemobacteraceae bacterium]